MPNIWRPCCRRFPRYYKDCLLLSRYVAADLHGKPWDISNVLDDYIRMLIQIRCSVDNCATDGKEADAIYQMFASSRDYRDSIDVVDNGPIRKAYVLYLDIADEPAESLPLPPSLPWTRSALKTSASSTTANSSRAFWKSNFMKKTLWNGPLHFWKSANYIVYER